MLEAIFLGKHGIDELNVDRQTEAYTDELRVAMMFMSGSIRNESLKLVIDYARQALPGYVVAGVYGDETSNADAERDVKDIIEDARKDNKHVLIISAGMAQRSFSVPEITELYLAYDGGDNGATIQKMSRALTPGSEGKVGRIFSLSFDPNRDDKFEALIIETAENYKKTHNKKSLREAFDDVIRTMDIFSCGPEGRIKIEPDEYLKTALSNKSVSRVIGKIANVYKLDDAEVVALANGNSDYFRGERQEKAQTGKTRKAPKKASNPGKKKVTDNVLKKAREVIVTIVENIDIIIYGTATTTLTDAFRVLESHEEYQSDILGEFGVEFHVIKHLFERGVINSDFVELIHDNTWHTIHFLL